MWISPYRAIKVRWHAHFTKNYNSIHSTLFKVDDYTTIVRVKSQYLGIPYTAGLESQVWVNAELGRIQMWWWTEPKSQIKHVQIGKCVSGSECYTPSLLLATCLSPTGAFHSTYSHFTNQLHSFFAVKAGAIWNGHSKSLNPMKFTSFVVFVQTHKQAWF